MTGFRQRMESIGAHGLLFAVVGFLIGVMCGFGHADRNSSVARGQLRIEVGEASPINIKRNSGIPVAKLAPATAEGCWP